MYIMKNRHLLFSVISFVLALSAMLASVFALDFAQLNINGSLGYSMSYEGKTATELNNIFQTSKHEIYDIYNNLTKDNVDNFLSFLNTNPNLIYNDMSKEEIIEKLNGFKPLCGYLIFANTSIYPTPTDNLKDVSYYNNELPQLGSDNLWKFTISTPRMYDTMGEFYLLTLDIRTSKVGLYETLLADKKSKTLTYSCELPTIGIIFYNM